MALPPKRGCGALRHPREAREFGGAPSSPMVSGEPHRADDAQEESHEGKAAHTHTHTSWGQVTCHNELSVVSKHDHMSRTDA